MSTDLPPGAARAFYGTPQHETRPPTDAERVRVVPAPSPPADRELHGYADRSSGERRRIYADALRRRVALAHADAEVRRTPDMDSSSGARGIMVRW